MFIVIEGLDGTGKSTISKKLAERLSAKLISTPGHSFKDIRKPLDIIFSESTKARQLFYAATVLKASEQVRALVSSAQHVVADRYWLSTQVYHNWMCHGEHLNLNDVEYELITPDLTVYLELSLKERHKRVSMRNNNTPQDIKTLTPQATDTLHNLYLNMRDSQVVGKWLRVDASNEIEFIIDTIMEKLIELDKSLS
ncbi:thymidylate kinase [Vibrio parahaemolyticus]|uniref:dTMP kinase n=1 Tax=Vibrio parahaemolyticus TaxID=670 RepID=UPI001D169A51|nr:dTMP kinase [Vibrio parahaemolyticus]MCC3842181.1 thymidylate kinase [Vibrio parahaemolyticus]MDF4742599.1 dTMP kinase [Vibrio parahaemolyticus]